jgi:hypothetical protein
MFNPIVPNNNKTIGNGDLDLISYSLAVDMKNGDVII